MIEAFKPDGGLWLLRDSVTGDTIPERGPYVEHKTANRAARRLNGEDEPSDLPPVTFPTTHHQPLAPEVFHQPPEGSPEPVETAVVVTLHSDGPASTAPAVGRDSSIRHAWLEDAADWAASRLETVGLDVPDRVRVTIGWPLGSRGGQHAIGQCWDASASKDGTREVFVSPELDDGARICDVLLHELIHASLPTEAKHGPQFRKWALLAGLEGKMTATTAGPDLTAAIAEFISVRGPFPTAGLDRASKSRPKQSTRLIKVQCPACEYTLRTTAKWLAIATPTCPDGSCDRFGEPMHYEGADEGEDGGEGEED